ncbi:hypothetical protein VQ270_000134 [Salmonella enterica]|nr:hypothetical protein [Salmonella enterica]EJJ4348340.1 hypothetical protein [Salmonella enterica]EJJ4352805.1 hypothetical protein [Salmonella enterica]EJJ4424389.1 hypothetical protein [Salmonella enterica]EJJ4455212.1 hypothetical protein [Salmonella enterica]
MTFSLLYRLNKDSLCVEPAVSLQINQIRHDRPLTREALMQYTPGVSGEDIAGNPTSAAPHSAYSQTPQTMLLPGMAFSFISA